MNKKIKIILAALTLTFMVGCQSTNQESSKNANSVQIEERDDLVERTNDGRILLDKSNVINTFVSTSANEISGYLNKRDLESTIAYCNGIVKNDKRKETDKVISEMPDQMKSYKGKKLAESLADYYFEYMSILEEVAGGKLDDEVMNRLSRFNEKSQSVTNEILNFATDH